MKLGVLASGRGSNLQALLDASAKNDLAGAKVACVVCNVPGAGALDRASKAGIPAELVDHKAFKDRGAFDRALVEKLRAHGVELVCLAGFMRIVGKDLLEAFPRAVVNIHPSLLPSFPGLHAHRQAIEAGVKVSGVTVHFVDGGTDTGPIILQTPVPVLDGDTEDSLSARVLVEEHKIYPAAVRLIAGKKIRLEGRRVVPA